MYIVPLVGTYLLLIYRSAFLSLPVHLSESTKSEILPLIKYTLYQFEFNSDHFILCILLAIPVVTRSFSLIIMFLFMLTLFFSIKIEMLLSNFIIAILFIRSRFRQGKI